jgi:hypothetical protein
MAYGYGTAVLDLVRRHLESRDEVDEFLVVCPWIDGVD